MPEVDGNKVQDEIKPRAVSGPNVTLPLPDKQKYTMHATPKVTPGQPIFQRKVEANPIIKKVEHKFQELPAKEVKQKKEKLLLSPVSEFELMTKPLLHKKVRVVLIFHQWTGLKPDLTREIEGTLTAVCAFGIRIDTGRIISKVAIAMIEVIEDQLSQSNQESRIEGGMSH